MQLTIAEVQVVHSEITNPDGTNTNSPVWVEPERVESSTLFMRPQLAATPARVAVAMGYAARGAVGIAALSEREALRAPAVARELSGGLLEGSATMALLAAVHPLRPFYCGGDGATTALSLLSGAFMAVHVPGDASFLAAALVEARSTPRGDEDEDVIDLTVEDAPEEDAPEGYAPEEAPVVVIDDDAPDDDVIVLD